MSRARRSTCKLRQPPSLRQRLERNQSAYRSGRPVPSTRGLEIVRWPSKGQLPCRCHGHLLLHAVFWYSHLVQLGLQSSHCLWKLWAKNPGAQAGYDYVGAFQDIVSADLDNQIAVAKALFQTYLTDATNTWNDSLVIAQHGSAVVKANQAALKDFATNIGKYIAYDKLGMLK